MKSLLILSVLLAGVLVATAAAVGAAEAAPQKLQEDNQLVEKEAAEFVPEVGAAETAPQKLQEDNQLIEEEAADFVPEAKHSEKVSAGEVASSPQGRFFTCPSGWDKYNGDCYQFVAYYTTWSSAVSYCASYGASLASAHDLFDYSFLQDLTNRAGYTSAWMGGFYFQAWRWLDQSSFSYSNWYSYNTETSYPCIYLNTGVGWSNTVCTYSFPFICVKKTDC